MKRKIRHFGIVTLLFLLSLLPRVKNIQTGSYPTAIPHLQVLQTLRVWQTEGGRRYAYLPVQTWTNPNDKFVTYFERLQNTRGDNYYVSYPPFAFILAHGFCRVFGVALTVVSITVLNLLLLWLAACCMFGIARQLIPRRENEGVFWPGIAAAAVFMCNPASMRLFSQVYFSEAVGTALLCVFLYFAVWLTRMPRSKGALAGMVVSMFLLAYTEWVGLFAAAVFGIYWFVKAIKNKAFRLPVILLGVAVLAALLLFAYQLDVVTGGGDFIANIRERYMARTGMRAREKSVGDTVFKDGFWAWLLSNLRVTLFAARWFLPALLLGVWVYRRRHREPLGIDSLSRTLFALILGTVALNFLVLFNFSMMHSYTWAKWGIPFGLVTGWCVYVLMVEARFKWVMPLIVLAFFATDLVFYYGFSSKDEAPDYWKELTAYIKTEARPNETIYVTTVSEEVDPVFHLTYYTGRNMANVPSIEEAERQATQLGRTHIVWFDFNQFESRKQAHHITLP